MSFENNLMNFMKKTPNHLGDYSDKTRIGSSAVSGHLGDTYRKLQKATLEIRQILAQWQPNSILEQLYVVNIKDDALTLSVKSHTAANHLRYQQHQLIDILNDHVRHHGNSQTLTFKQLNSLRFVVVDLSRP
ncbi:hypothetical protein B0682_05880 [Moraxella lincolnii]|uniref:DUF721 domain-containing protein n=2 Tax=Lwoffella lincolnii TaxID=90241 RepID=A0A1T0CE91_9GAMM|nr:hypothetical protein B0682_05880 [Moraxella lincolnii]